MNIFSQFSIFSLKRLCSFGILFVLIASFFCLPINISHAEEVKPVMQEHASSSSSHQHHNSSSSSCTLCADHLLDAVKGNNEDTAPQVLKLFVPFYNTTSFSQKVFLERLSYGKSDAPPPKSQIALLASVRKKE